jgi:hypothetical protein
MACWRRTECSMGRNLGFSTKVEGDGGRVRVVPRARVGDERGDERRDRMC